MVVSERTAAPGDDRRVYANRRRQRLYASGLVAVFLVTLSQVFEPDPSTGLKPLPGDYLWVVIPGTILVGVLVFRAYKARIETDGRGVSVYRTVGHEFIAWSDVRRFEVHPTPSGQGSAVVLRRHDESIYPVRSEVNIRPVRPILPLRARTEARRRARARAEALFEQLEEDRRERLSSARPGDGRPPASGGGAIASG